MTDTTLNPTALPAPKPQVRYRFFCKICGTPFRAMKKHAITCSTTCRVAWNKIDKFGLIETGDEMTPDQIDLAERKVRHAKGEDVDITPLEQQGPVGKILNGKLGKKVTPEVIGDPIIPAKAAGDGVKVPEPVKEATPPDPKKQRK